MNGNLYSQYNMSQVEKVFTHLIKHGKITPEECLDLYNIKYLAKCISRLKERKVNIYSVFCDTEKRLDSKVKEYVLCKEQPPQVKKMIETCQGNFLQKIA